MLRAKDGSTPRSVAFLSIGVTLMVFTAIAATGLRASEESPTTAVKMIEDRIDSGGTPFDVRQLPFSQQGAFVVRPSMLLGEQMGTYGPLLRAAFSEYLKHMELGDISLDKIEFIAGSLSGPTVTGAGNTGFFVSSGMLSFASSGLVGKKLEWQSTGTPSATFSLETFDGGGQRMRLTFDDGVGDIDQKSFTPEEEINVGTVSVPEPGSFLCLGLVGVLALGKRRLRHSFSVRQ